MTDKIDLLLTFIEQERDYAKETLANTDKVHSGKAALILNKRIAWFNTLIGTLNELKTEEGVENLKKAIEHEKQRKSEVDPRCLKQIKDYCRKEYKELTDHFHDAIARKGSLEIWYYSGALMELAYFKGHFGIEEDTDV